MLKILWRERSKAKQMSQYRHIARPAPGYSYTVQRGDRLKSIAMQAYSDDSQPVLQAIYNANRSIIGDDPDWLVAGQVLHIPVSPNAEPANVVGGTIGFWRWLIERQNDAEKRAEARSQEAWSRF